MKQLAGFLLDSLHLFVLVAVGIAWPLLGDLADRPAYFLLSTWTPRDVVWAALLPSVALPLLLVAVEGVAAIFGHAARKTVHGVLIGVLAAAVALPAAHAATAGGGALVAAAVAGGVFTLAYFALRPVRILLALLAPIALAAPAFFLSRPAVASFATEPRMDQPDGQGSRPGGVPVVLVVFDELPTPALLDENGSIDGSRFPAFAALAGEAIWFRNATTVGETTENVLPAILSGRYPDRPDPGFGTVRRHNLFTALAASHRLRALEPQLPLCPRDLCGGADGEPSPSRRLASLVSTLISMFRQAVLADAMPPDLPYDVVRVSPADGYAVDPAGDRGSFPDVWHPRYRLLRFSRFVDRLGRAGGERPTFDYLHVMLPREPVRYVPTGQVCTSSRGRPPRRWGEDAGAVAAAYERYLLQLRFVDELLARIVDRLRSTGRYDESLVVITATRGVSHRPGDERTVATPTNYCDVLQVPLLVKLPHQTRGRLSDRNVELIDIAPTIADVVGAELPWTVDGRSVLDDSVPDRLHKVFVSTSGALGAGAAPGEPVRMTSFLRRECSGRPEPRVPLPSPELRDLIGRRVADLDIEGVSSLQVEIDAAGEFEDVALASSAIPCEVSGRVAGVHGRRPEAWLAFAINGRVAAVGRTFAVQDASARFHALVPAAAYREGRNDVDVLVVRESARGIHLLEAILRPPGGAAGAAP